MVICALKRAFPQECASGFSRGDLFSASKNAFFTLGKDLTSTKKEKIAKILNLLFFFLKHQEGKNALEVCSTDAV